MELDRLQRDRRILVPMLVVAIVIESFALVEVLTNNTGWLASCIATVCTTVLGVLTGLTQVRIEGIEDELD